jgi:hypothetical protein
VNQSAVESTLPRSIRRQRECATANNGDQLADCDENFLVHEDAKNDHHCQAIEFVRVENLYALMCE